MYFYQKRPWWVVKILKEDSRRNIKTVFDCRWKKILKPIDDEDRQLTLPGIKSSHCLSPFELTMMLRKCHMGFIQTSKMARNMCFRQIVNICRLSRKTFSVSDLQNKLKLFSFVGNSIDNRIIHQHRARCITTSSRLHNKVSDVSDDQLKKLMDQLWEKFTEARELLDDVVSLLYLFSFILMFKYFNFIVYILRIELHPFD